MLASTKSAEPATSNVIALPPRARTIRRDELEFLPAALEIMETPATPLGRAITGALLAFVVIAIAWACIGRVDIIATAQGKVVPVGRIKVIQPLQAGTVTAIRVRDGDRVKAGDVLVELDHTVSAAERSHVMEDLIAARLDAARLSALRAGIAAGGQDAGNLVLVDFKPPAAAPPHAVMRTRGQMQAQADQQAAKLAALDHQIAQKVAEANETAATIAKLQDGLPWLEQTADIREKAKNLLYGNVIAHLDAQLKLSEQRHELIVQQRKAVETEAARQALEAQRRQAQAEYAQDLASDLAEAEQKAAQSADDLIKADKKIEDETLRAPIDGIVQQLALHTIGGVVTPARQLMVVVPADAHLEVEAMVQNRDIGFVHDGDAAEIKIDTFNFTKYGLLHGKVLNISGDAIQRDTPPTQNGNGGGTKDERNNSTSARTSEPPGQELLYAARIGLDTTRMEVEGRMVDLEPGMAVTVEMKTGQRRIIEYLLSPLLRYRQESLRER
jgi:hemolysin D